MEVPPLAPTKHLVWIRYLGDIPRIRKGAEIYSFYMGAYTQAGYIIENIARSFDMEWENLFACFTIKLRLADNTFRDLINGWEVNGWEDHPIYPNYDNDNYVVEMIMDDKRNESGDPQLSGSHYNSDCLTAACSTPFVYYNAERLIGMPTRCDNCCSYVNSAHIIGRDKCIICCLKHLKPHQLGDFMCDTCFLMHYEPDPEDKAMPYKKRTMTMRKSARR